MADTHVGSTIGGRYRVVDKLGEGGMSIVWHARDTRLERFVAIKEIKNNASDDTHRADVATMRREAHIMKDLDHPNIVHVHDIIDENNALYVVMDYVPGKDLSKVMRENKANMQVPVFAFPEEDVIDWGKQLCNALGYLHLQNPPIIYRDMKPGNVMLTDDGSIKIIDFGIAREFKPNQNQDTVPLGTRGYASPEAAEKVSQTDARSDVYSLGVTLFQLVTGHGPMEYVKQANLPHIRDIDPTLSPALDAIIVKATEWDPDLRQQSMAEMELELDKLETPEHERWMRRIWRTFQVLGILGIVVVLTGVGSLVGSNMVRNSSYAGLIERAKVANKIEDGGAASEAELLYREAIEIDPVKTEAYMALVNDVYIADDEFSPDEARRWKNEIFGPHEAAISGTEEYAELCYDAGIDYFIYYSYADKDELERGTAAVEWFDRSLNDFEMRVERGERPSENNENGVYDGDFSMTQWQANAAGIYKSISEFSSLIKQVRGGDNRKTSESAAYAEYFDDLRQAVEDSGSEDTIIKLRLYNVVFRALKAPEYLSGFRNAGHTRNDVLSLLELVKDRTAKLQSESQDSDVTRALYNDIIGGYEDAKGIIETNFAASDRLTSLTSSGGTNAATSQGQTSTTGGGQS